jgi:sugar lactone lactonase YvrE
MRTHHKSSVVPLIALTALAALLLAPGARAQDEFGPVDVFATVPTPPGFPEGLAVRDGIVYAAGPAAPGTAGNNTPSSVVAFDALTGQQLAVFETQGENRDAEHSNTCIAFDGSGRLYVLNSQLGVYRLDVTTGTQEPYGAAIPRIPACLFARAGAVCSPAVRNREPLINDIVFDSAGNAYITDSWQATIWKVAAGGGEPEVWFQTYLFNSSLLGFIGVNGIRLHPDGTRLFVTVTSDILNRGVIYTLPLMDAPEQADLQEFARLDRGDKPDGIAFGASGRLYVAVNADTPMVLVLNPDGSEYGRIVSDLFVSPANVAFDGNGNLLIVNHPISAGRQDPSLFKITKVFVGDTDGSLLFPDIP